MPDEISTLLKRIGIFSFLVIIFLWIYQDPQRDESGSIVEAGNIDPLELYAGDCYKDNYALEADEVENVYSVDALPCSCLLYTSDAADDSLRVDLGGRRIIKKAS